MFSYEIVVLSLIKAEKYTVTPQHCVFILHLCPQEIAMVFQEAAMSVGLSIQSLLNNAVGVWYPGYLRCYIM